MDNHDENKNDEVVRLQLDLMDEVRAFWDFCSQLGIMNHYSSPAHPQANGQVEIMNRFLLKIIKTRLEGAKGIWLEELPSVLWAYRTTTRTLTGETPF